MAAAKRKPQKSREEQVKQLAIAVSGLVVLAEAAAELHMSASTCATVLAELVEDLRLMQEAKPRK